MCEAKYIRNKIILVMIILTTIIPSLTYSYNSESSGLKSGFREIESSLQNGVCDLILLLNMELLFRGNDEDS